MGIESAIRYRALLKKYMARVIASEGVAFLPSHQDKDPDFFPTDYGIHWTDEEMKELRQIASEIDGGDRNNG